jgi:uncharacterized SAM-binding protein YcdF (DUF218 family)
MKVAVILGNRLNNDKTITEVMKRRLELGVKLDKQLTIDKIIVSGGVSNQTAGIPEADQMFEYLAAKGVEAGKIVKENQSRSVAENAKNAILAALGLGADTVILCSTHEHLNQWFKNPVKFFKKQLKNTQAELIVYSDGHIQEKGL